MEQSAGSSAAGTCILLRVVRPSAVRGGPDLRGSWGAGEPGGKPPRKPAVQRGAGPEMEAAQDGASQDGASQDGASQDGVSQDGASPGLPTRHLSSGFRGVSRRM